MWAQIQRDKIRDGHSIPLLQLIADLTDEARRKDSANSFASFNQEPSRGRSNGRGRGQGASRPNDRSASSGNQSPAEDAPDRCGWCKKRHRGGEDYCWMKHTHLRPDWWRPGERSGSGGSQNGAASNTNEASRGTSNQSSQATNSAISSIFATQAIGPTATALGTNIKDSWMADSCSNIHICNDIRRFVEYEEIEPLQIQTGGGLIKAIAVGSVELTVARTDHSAHTITFTKVYHCPDFFTNVVSLSVLRRKGAFFNGLHNTINFVKDRAEIAYIPCINGLNSFILLDDPVRPCLIEELLTKDAVLEVSQALQEESEASRALQEEDEVSQASQSGGDF